MDRKEIISMKKYQSLVIILLTCLYLSACTNDPQASELYKQESPLEAAIILPEVYGPTTPSTISVVLTQDGEKVENPDYVHLEIWKQDGTEKYGMTEAHKDGNGQYSLTKNFKHDGLYYVQVHASNNNSIIMPTKQFILGELSQSDLLALQSDVPSSDGNSHSHH